MLFKNIVVPFDNSESARNALKRAVEFAVADKDVQVQVISIMAIDTQTYMSYLSPFGLRFRSGALRLFTCCRNRYGYRRFAIIGASERRS